jgi:hypothetical protein
MLNDREKLIDLIENAPVWKSASFHESCTQVADHLIANGVTVQERARPLEEWGEDYGDVLWWKFPIEEPPYVGSPLDEKWTGYHTHCTQIPIPDAPKDGDT